MLLRLQLINTGEFMVMDSDGSLTIEINSTAFNDQDDFLGSLSYSGSQPLEGNKAFIRNAHFIATSADLRQLDILAWLGNLPWKVVKYVFTVENGTINYNLLIDKGIIAKDMSSRSLMQTDDGGGNLGSYTADTFGQFMLDTATAAPGTYPVVFFPIKNDAAYKDIPEDQWGDYQDIAFPVDHYMNAWKVVDGVGSFVIDEASDEQRETQIAFYSLVYVLKKVLKFYGLTPIGSWLKDPDALRIYIYTPVPILAYIVPDYPNSMPDMPIADFLKEVRNNFGLLIDVDQTRKVAIVESIKNLEDTSDTIDLTHKQLIDYREIATDTNGYTISQSIDNNDQAFSDDDKNNLPKLIIGDGTTDIPLNSVMTKMIVEQSPETVSSANWKLPYIKGPIPPVAPFTQIQNMDYKDRNNFKLRFLYYHGMVPDSSGFEYPYGSSDNTDQAGTQLTTFTLSLTPSGNSYQSLKHKYEFIKNSKPMELGFELTKEEFLSLSVKKRILIRDFNQAPVSALLSSFSADIAGQQSVLAKLTLYPVIRPNNKVQILDTDPDTPAPPVDNGVVYVKLQFRNGERIDFPLPPPGFQTYQADLYAVFFEDPAATIPKEVDRLPVRYNIRLTDPTGTHDSIVTTECTGEEFEMYHHAPISSTSGGYASWTYTLMASAYYHILT